MRLKPKSVISVMMIIALFLKQMFCYFEGAMGFHCNREATKTDDKKMDSLARNSLMTDLGLINHQARLTSRYNDKHTYHTVKWHLKLTGIDYYNNISHISMIICIFVC